MEAISTIILEEFMGDAGRTTPERFTEIVVNSQFSVWFIYFFLTSAILGYFLTGQAVVELPEPYKQPSSRSGPNAGPSQWPRK
jgi:hypothetical protein